MAASKHDPFVCTAENAPKIKEWFASRGGIAVWRSINLSNPGASWTTPLNDASGAPSQRPNWQCASEPERVITDHREVLVMTPIEVKRFQVAVRRGANNPTLLKLTDSSAAKVRWAVDKAGEGAWHEFDYARQQAIIYKPGPTRMLEEV